MGSAILAVMMIGTCAPRAARAVSIALTPFATGFSAPTDIVNAGDSRLFVVEQAGHIKVVQSNGTVLGPDFLDVSGLVSGGGEEGLLGLAFHPNYLSNGFFYIYYTNLSGNIVIARYSVSGSPMTSNLADPLSAQILLTIPHPTNTNHNGGDLIFGPNDGYLYLGTGDGGSGCDPPDNAQNTNVLLGKLLRINVDSGSPYGIPPTNPFATSGTTAHEIWALGMRNPFRFSFDRANGNLYIGNVGQNAWEEVDFQLASSSGGQNYGWNCREGLHSSTDSGCVTTDPCTGPFVDPVHEYDHSGGRCAIIGGYVYRGSQSPAIVGHYFFADLCSNDFYSLTTPDNGMTWNNNSFGVPVGGLSPTTFGEGADGEIYVGGDGSDTIYHITAGVPPPACSATPATGCTATSKASITLKNPGDATKNKLTWKWLDGPALMQSDFGDPVAGGTSYELCLYVGTSAALVHAGIPSLTGWKPVSSTGYKFHAPAAGGDGIFKALLKGGVAGKSKLLVKGKGVSLNLSALPLDASTPVLVQLVRNDDASCWEAAFPIGSISADDTTLFKAKIP